MIIGGYDRGLDLSELAITLRGYNTSLRKVLVIGASGDRLIQAFKEAGFDNFELMESKDMLAIVRTASQIAQTGDAVVLSPGFASFDMFKNFKERGNKFNEAVDSL